jgi:hypothetical protein
MLVDKLPDVANIALGAFFFGQFIADRAFSPFLGLFGLGLWLLLIGWLIVLAGGEE